MEPSAEPPASPHPLGSFRPRVLELVDEMVHAGFSRDRSTAELIDLLLVVAKRLGDLA